MTSASNNGSMMDWQSGIGTMQDGINRVFETGEHSDVEFMVGKQLWDVKSQNWIPMEEPKLFKAHKFVLSIRSPVFATQFGFNNGQQQNNEPIKVIDITVSAFEALLAFLYKNDLSLINSDNFLEVYSAARKYLLQVLVEKCNELAPKMLKWKNSVDVWRTAKLHEDKVLIGHCLKFFDNNIRTVEEGDVYFWSLKRDELEELLKRDTLRTNWESNLFYFLEYWALKQCKNEGIDKPTGQEKRDKMGTLINVVRFPLIPPAIFTKYIVPTGILTAEEVALIFIHYSEDVSVKFKQLNPLPFSSQPRAIRPQGVYNKLVDKNFVEREKMQLITNNVLLENKKKESEGKIKQLENEKKESEEKVKELEKKAKENEEKIQQFEKKAKENEKTIKQLEKKAKEMEETIKRLEKNVPKTNTSLRAGGKRKKGM